MAELGGVWPDVTLMFQVYDKLYFDSQLIVNGCFVRWSSKRMTLCAGTCEKLAGGVAITLSEPLLKFRSLHDLQSTLLHEMIHAFFFVSSRSHNLDRSGHGPDFLAKAELIISASAAADPFRSGTGDRYAITTYHSFHDEVDHYRTHRWKCARCGGLVKRSMNRAPTRADCRFYRRAHAQKADKACEDVKSCMWHGHMARCGGSYTKIQGPEKATGVKKRRTASGLRRPAEGAANDNSVHRLTDFFPSATNEVVDLNKYSNPIPEIIVIDDDDTL